MSDDEPKKVVQCKSCPWRVGCEPDKDIPNYKRDLHEGLTDTIAKPGDLSTMFCSSRKIMACHYSKPGEEFPCAGWLHNQIGPGNNIGIRLAVMTGQMPVPVTDGPQYETFEETLCSGPGRTRSASTRSGGTASANPTSNSTSRRAADRATLTTKAPASTKKRSRALNASHEAKRKRP